MGNLKLMLMQLYDMNNETWSSTNVYRVGW